MTHQIPDNMSKKRKALIDVCRTRWAARHLAYQHFYQSYEYIIMALEHIAHNLHQENCGDEFVGSKWDSKSRAEASGLLTGVTSFDFILTFVVVYQVLSHLAGITIKLQKSTIDIISAYQEVLRSNSFLIRNFNIEKFTDHQNTLIYK
jgi:hypothetical protein